MAVDNWTKEEFLQCISDLHKDAYGFRREFSYYNEMTREELLDEWKHLEKIAIDNFWDRG